MGERTVARYPIVSNSRDGVVLPIAAYLQYRSEQDTSEKALEADAYCLAEFWDYLSSMKISYDLITPHILRQYFDRGAKRASNVVFLRATDATVIYKETIRRKRGRIYDFYHVLQNRLELVSGILAPRAASTSATYRLPAIPVGIGLGVPLASNNDHHTRHEARKAKERKRRPKSTPSILDAESILDRLLERSDGNRGSTYYLAASLEMYGGARGCGVEDLTLTALAEAVLDEPEMARVIRPIARTFNGANLADANNGSLGITILRALKTLQTAGRRYIFAMVIEKGKARPLPITVSLALEILDYIWSDRRAFVERRRARIPHYNPPDNVFLSYKTGEALRAGSMSRVIGGKLREVGLSATAHRLRATFAEQIVYDLYHKDRAANGGRADFISIIELAREMLGHTSDKAIRKYLNNITKNDRLLRGHVVIVEDASDFALLDEIAKRLDASKDETIRRALAEIIAAA